MTHGGVRTNARMETQITDENRFISFKDCIIATTQGADTDSSPS